MTITKTAIPAQSQLHATAQGAYYHDTYEASIADASANPLDLMLQTFTRTPRWIDALMRTRNRIVALCGLKDLGALSNIDPAKSQESYRIGDRVGIFSIQALSGDEVILSDSDKHLNVQISVYRHGGDVPKVAVTTVVYVHNFLGRAYLFFVIPVHKRIVPAMLRTMGASPSA